MKSKPNTKLAAKVEPLALDSRAATPKADNKLAKTQNQQIKSKHSGMAGKLMYSADQLSEKCKAYIDHSKEVDEKPTWQGLAGWLDITSETLTIWLQDKNRMSDSTTQAVSAVLKKTADQISHRLQQRTDSMALLSMNQPLYGGFTNRPDAGSGGLVAINVSFGQSDGKIVAEYGK